MKVSVLIPVYGVERYIEECARSLMEQTYGDIEYIFVDDCTPDDSINRLRDVIGRYPQREPQVKILTHSRNSGLAAARLSALEAATGDAVLIVDSDDYIAAKAVECLVGAMQAQGVDIVDGGYAIVAHGKVVKDGVPPHVTGDKYLKMILCQNVEPNRIWGRLIKRSLFADGITFTPGIDYCEDYSVLPRLLYLAKRGWVDNCVYFYRNDNPDSYTNNITARNAVSFLKAQQLVGDFMVATSMWSRYRFATEVGWAAVWRFARRQGMELRIVEEHFSHRPSCLVTRCLCAVLRSKLPLALGDFAYKAVRNFYLSRQ